MILKFWGTRGSIPVPGKDTIKYGGNTPCIEVRSQMDKLLILDAGSGLRELGKELRKDPRDKQINILISHYHWDHIQGIPFFLPLYNSECDICFWGENSKDASIKTLLGNQMNNNYFPIGLNDLSALINYNEIKIGYDVEINGLKISAFRANHSSPTLTYKISENGKSVVYMTDNELHIKDNENTNQLNAVKELNKDLIEFCRGSDYLIHDSMYDEATMLNKKGWGHTSNKTLAFFGMIAEVKNIVLFHYNPDYSDDKIDLLLKETSFILEKHKSETKCIAAKEGMKISL